MDGVIQGTIEVPFPCLIGRIGVYAIGGDANLFARFPCLIGRIGVSIHYTDIEKRFGFPCLIGRIGVLWENSSFPETAKVSMPHR